MWNSCELLRALSTVMYILENNQQKSLVPDKMINQSYVSSRIWTDIEMQL